MNASLGLRDMPMTIPCNMCLDCRLKKTREWGIRLYHESQFYDDSMFLTLTYDDEHLPSPLTLYPRHITLFLKKLRKMIQTKHAKKIRFYQCGEYGEKNHRPHHHAIIFGYWPEDAKFHKMVRDKKYFKSDTVDKIWGHGYAHFSYVTPSNARYVSGYVHKKVVGAKASLHYESVDPATGQIYQRKPEYATMSLGDNDGSRGIGYRWFIKYHEYLYAHDHVIIDGKPRNVPKYYDTLCEQLYPDLWQKVREKRAKFYNQFRPENMDPEIRVDQRLVAHETITKARAAGRNQEF